MNEVKPKRRWRYWLTAFVALVVAVYTTLFFRGRLALNGALAKLDRDDPGWRMADLEATRPKLPDDRNSAVTLGRIRAMTPQGFPNSDDDKALSELTPNVVLTAEQLAALGRLTNLDPAIVGLLRQLSEQPQGHFDLNWSNGVSGMSLDIMQTVRGSANLIRYSLEVRLAAGDAAGAIQLLKALANTASSISDEPTLIAQLVRMSVHAVRINSLERAIAMTEFSGDDLRSIQADLESIDREPLLTRVIRGERAFIHETLNLVASGSPTELANLIDVNTTADYMNGLYFRYIAGFTAARIALLDYLTEAVTLAKMPEAEHSKDLWAALEKRSAELPPLFRTVVPAVTGAAEAVRRQRARTRCAIVAVAAERFRLANGRWPHDIAELVSAGLLSAVPTDPYDGKPLRFVAKSGKWHVYSIGSDRTDDGGAIDPLRGTVPGTDLVFRLWLPEQRRQPPPVQPIASK